MTSLETLQHTVHFWLISYSVTIVQVPAQMTKGKSNRSLLALVCGAFIIVACSTNRAAVPPEATTVSSGSSADSAPCPCGFDLINQDFENLRIAAIPSTVLAAHLDHLLCKDDAPEPGIRETSLEWKFFDIGPEQRVNWLFAILIVSEIDDTGGCLLLKDERPFIVSKKTSKIETHSCRMQIIQSQAWEFFGCPYDGS